MVDCKVVLTTDQNSRWLKILRAKEPTVEKGERAKTDAQLIQVALLDHISGKVLYTERQAASSSVKEF